MKRDKYPLLYQVGVLVDTEGEEAASVFVDSLSETEMAQLAEEIDQFMTEESEHESEAIILIKHSNNPYWS